MDDDEKTRLFEEGRNAARRGLFVDRSVSSDPADQPFRDGYSTERDEAWERAQEQEKKAREE